MSASVGNRWNRGSGAVAIALPFSAAFEVTPMRERLSILRDTIIVLSMQIAFRASMLLRRLNY